MEGQQSKEELEANLQEYRGQLKQVEQLLLMGESVDQEMQDMYTSLTEVIQLTEELLREAGGSVDAEAGTSGAAQAAGSSAAAPAAQQAAGTSQEAVAAGAGEQGEAIVTPPALNLPSILPSSVAEQIRKAQIRAALAGQAPAAWALGAKVQALYPADGQWYEAAVEAVTPEGKFVIAYEGYAEKEELAVGSVRERAEAPEIYQGVAAPKRKRVEEQPVITEVPKWLEIKKEDDEKTVARKKKLIKSYKSKIRFQNMDLETKKKQDSWKSFITGGKAAKKKTGFFTGHKKESIFAVPEGVNSKVGVVGSGKGMTQYQKQRRVENAADVAGGEV